MITVAAAGAAGKTTRGCHDVPQFTTFHGNNAAALLVVVEIALFAFLAGRLFLPAGTEC